MLRYYLYIPLSPTFFASPSTFIVTPVRMHFPSPACGRGVRGEGKSNMNKIQKAIGLIEIMLVLVVVAIMAIASIKYYTSTQAAQKVNDAVQIFGEVRSAFNN